VVEILSAALQGGAFLHALSGEKDGKKVPHALGHFFIAIDIEAFTSLDEFKKTTGDILRELRASKKAPGKERIYTAGEKEYLTSIERGKNGQGLWLRHSCGNSLGRIARWSFPPRLIR